MKLKTKLIGAAAILFPAVAFAQNFTYVNNWLNFGASWLRVGITIVMILMTLYFLISVFRFISNKDAAKAAEKRQLMINGMIGLFVAVAVWGIIKLAASIFGVSTTDQVGGQVDNIACPPGYHYNGGTHTCEL